EIVLPPLRDHREDIPALAEHFARRYAERFVIDARLSAGLIEHLRGADWPGNVRQLENTIARALAMSAGGELGIHSLGQRCADASTRADTGRAGISSLKDQINALERRVIARAMAAVDNNQTRAARELGLSRGALIDRLKRHGLFADAR